MNRNYLPPSLMHSGPMDSRQESMMMVVTAESGEEGAIGVGLTTSANENGSQRPNHQIHQLYQGISALPHHHHQLQQAASAGIVISSPMGSSNGPPVNGGGPAPTRRSISFTGGVPVAGGHPFHHQYTQMLPPKPPQVAHQSSTYPQLALGGQGIPNSSAPAPPIRSGRIDRFSRTCKLPTVQEVGKLSRLAHPSTFTTRTETAMWKIKTDKKRNIGIAKIT